jgi:4-amino-4-deoxy-L-arabinose transferase-like glycosyltransferase
MHPTSSPRYGRLDGRAAVFPRSGVVPLRDAISQHVYLYFLLLCAFVARLTTIGAYPLTDNTEARYAEIARKMVETGQWLVPQIDYGVPFWGKPPLSMWLTAASYEAFGVSAFAARLPSLLLGVAVCVLVYRLGASRGGRELGLRASVVVATSLLMFVSAGAVMTDPAMLFGIALSMTGYWLALAERSRRWGYLFFVGLAIGLLAKGPVATVLTVLPIGVWAIATGRVAESRRRLPWLGGSLVAIVLVVPWYWAAEAASPGFLRYFLVGEHLQRFLVPGWKGDLYGVGHEYPRGTIGLFALAGTLPWSPWLLWRIGRHGLARTVEPLRAGDGWGLYLVCWMLAPVAFFTLSRNILPTYVLPGIAAFGLVVAHAWQRRDVSAPRRHFVLLALAAPALAALLLAAWTRVGFQSQREIVSAYRAVSTRDASLVYFRQRPYSAAFYSQGRARQAEDVQALREHLERSPGAYVATEARALALLPEDLRARLAEVATSQTGKYVLLHAVGDETAGREAPAGNSGFRGDEPIRDAHGSAPLVASTTACRANAGCCGGGFCGDGRGNASW